MSKAETRFAKVKALVNLFKDDDDSDVRAVIASYLALRGMNLDGKGGSAPGGNDEKSKSRGRSASKKKGKAVDSSASSPSSRGPKAEREARIGITYTDANNWNARLLQIKREISGLSDVERNKWASDHGVPAVAVDPKNVGAAVQRSQDILTWLRRGVYRDRAKGVNSEEPPVWDQSFRDLLS